MNMEFRVSLKDSKPCTGGVSEDRNNSAKRQIHRSSEVGHLAINHMQKTFYIISEHIYLYVAIHKSCLTNCQSFQMSQLLHKSKFTAKKRERCVLLLSFPVGVVPATHQTWHLGTVIKIFEDGHRNPGEEQNSACGNRKPPEYVRKKNSGKVR